MTSVIFSSRFSGDLALPLGILAAETSMDPDRYRGYKVVAVDHYKEKDNVGHESVVMHLRVGDDILDLLMERRPSARKPGGGRFSAATPYTRVTDDTIRRLNAPMDLRTHYHIVTLNFPPDSEVSLFDIARIYDAIATISPNYDLLREQCYWFSATLVSRLLEFPDVTELRMPDYGRAGKFAGHVPVISSLATDPGLTATRNTGSKWSLAWGSFFRRRKTNVVLEPHSHRPTAVSIFGAGSMPTAQVQSPRSSSICSGGGHPSYGEDTPVIADAFGVLLSSPVLSQMDESLRDRSAQCGEALSLACRSTTNTSGAMLSEDYVLPRAQVLTPYGEPLGGWGVNNVQEAALTIPDLAPNLRVMHLPLGNQTAVSSPADFAVSSPATATTLPAIPHSCVWIYPIRGIQCNGHLMDICARIVIMHLRSVRGYERVGSHGWACGWATSGGCTHDTREISLFSDGSASRLYVVLDIIASSVGSSGSSNSSSMSTSTSTAPASPFSTSSSSLMLSSIASPSSPVSSLLATISPSTLISPATAVSVVPAGSTSDALPGNTQAVSTASAATAASSSDASGEIPVSSSKGSDGVAGVFTVVALAGVGVVIGGLTWYRRKRQQLNDAGEAARLKTGDAPSYCTTDCTPAFISGGNGGHSWNDTTQPMSHTGMGACPHRPMRQVDIHMCGYANLKSYSAEYLSSTAYAMVWKLWDVKTWSDLTLNQDRSSH